MVTVTNLRGKITLTGECFMNLVACAATSCFGVSAMSYPTTSHRLLGKLTGKNGNHGVSVKNIEDRLYIRLHIIVSYGVNISEVVKSIVHKVKYAVESATGQIVQNVSVFVDGMADA